MKFEEAIALMRDEKTKCYPKNINPVCLYYFIKNNKLYVFCKNGGVNATQMLKSSNIFDEWEVYNND
jgi:hypothetical protein